jgi:hypothetical protein
VAGSLLALADRLAAAHERSTLVRTILWREADTHPEVARCMHTFHDEVVDFATRVIERADPNGIGGEARHAAALAWTGTVSLALNTARLGGSEHDLPVVAALLATALGAQPAAAAAT